MSHDVEYDENMKCDRCGKMGGWDFMGDCYCDACLTEDANGHTCVKGDDDDPSKTTI